MKEIDLFARTRQQLALFHAGVMGLIFAVMGFATYQFTAYERHQAIDREIESIAGTIHDSLEAKLTDRSRLNAAARELIPNLCIGELPCNSDSPSTPQHLVGFLNRDRYYLIILNLEGKIQATAGTIPTQITRLDRITTWMKVIDDRDRHYRQFSTMLHTRDRQDLGELRIGRNIDDIDRSLATLAFVLTLSLPLALITISGAGWYLAGIAIQPLYLAYDRQKLFTANVAHELRTPLATTQLTLDEYLTKYLELAPEFSQILQDIDRQNGRLIRVVADLLLLARLDRDRVAVTAQICYLDEILVDLVEEFSALVPDRQISIQIAPIYRPIAIKGEGDRITRLVSNLLDNATKYTRSGGTIKLSIAKKNQRTELTITDNGIGIAPIEIAKIFDPFYRINTDRSRQTGGTGLGLAIVKSIADLYDAKLQVLSELGIGSIFIVDFDSAF